MNVTFTATAWEQSVVWHAKDKKAKRINDLIKDIERNGVLKGIQCKAKKEGIKWHR